jgi:hypothetical protein
MKTHNELLKIIDESWFIGECLNPDLEIPKRIQAIKELRTISHVGLREAKEAVDAWMAGDRHVPDDSEMPLQVAGWIVSHVLRNSDSLNDLERRALRIVSDMACEAIDLSREFRL